MEGFREILSENNKSVVELLIMRKREIWWTPQTLVHEVGELPKIPHAEFLVFCYCGPKHAWAKEWGTHSFIFLIGTEVVPIAGKWKLMGSMVVKESCTASCKGTSLERPQYLISPFEDISVGS